MDWDGQALIDGITSAVAGVSRPQCDEGDLAGGTLPVDFGERGVWWIMVFGFQFECCLKSCAGGQWVYKRMKAIRFT